MFSTLGHLLEPCMQIAEGALTPCIPGSNHLSYFCNISPDSTPKQFIKANLSAVSLGSWMFKIQVFCPLDAVEEEKVGAAENCIPSPIRLVSSFFHFIVSQVGVGGRPRFGLELGVTGDMSVILSWVPLQRSWSSFLKV